MSSLLKRILLPLERAWEVEVTFRHGGTRRWTVSSMTKRESTASGDLEGLSWKGGRGVPFYWSLPDVLTIETRRCWRRRV